ncbi:hypothetical protein NC653_040430 [Populus alba x Populus x berolinensis]|uniref:Uncharacterized protein n=1 Tax=Populus alba x Populus x berolinensis TaxID=444605 RepID=A0AAD6PRN1_9ROSI|nr:hypothetical protein NC653_040430 [Populus alba x Populus x berolinensis]
MVNSEFGEFDQSGLVGVAPPSSLYYPPSFLSCLPLSGNSFCLFLSLPTQPTIQQARSRERSFFLLEEEE